LRILYRARGDYACGRFEHRARGGRAVTVVRFVAFFALVAFRNGGPGQ
jgi:hypothetical protein